MLQLTPVGCDLPLVKAVSLLDDLSHDGSIVVAEELGLEVVLDDEAFLDLASTVSTISLMWWCPRSNNCFGCSVDAQM